jgi:hypothetical protein
MSLERKALERLAGRGVRDAGGAARAIAARLPLAAHELDAVGALGGVQIVGATAQAQVRRRRLAPARDRLPVIELLWNDLSSRHPFLWMPVRG